MKKCKKCNCDLPARIWDGDRLKRTDHRTYCEACSPRKNPPLLPEYLLNAQYTCIWCNVTLPGKEFYIDRRDNSIRRVCRKCASAYTSHRQKDHKEKLLEYKGGVCVLCGCEESEVLQFHHVVKDQKNFNISMKIGRSLEKLKAEVDKCVVLCANCHIKAERQNISLEHLL